MQKDNNSLTPEKIIAGLREVADTLREERHANGGAITITVDDDLIGVLDEAVRLLSVPPTARRKVWDKQGFEYELVGSDRKDQCVLWVVGHDYYKFTTWSELTTSPPPAQQPVEPSPPKEGNKLAEVLQATHNYIFNRRWRSDGADYAEAQAICGEITKAVWSLPPAEPSPPNDRYQDLYHAVHPVIACLGAHGKIYADDDRVSVLMDVLHAIDGGEYKERRAPEPRGAQERLQGQLEAYAKAMTECTKTERRENGGIGARDCFEIRRAIDALHLRVLHSLSGETREGNYHSDFKKWYQSEDKVIKSELERSTRLAIDLMFHGSSFELVKPDGTRERLDPASVTIKLPDETVDNQPVKVHVSSNGTTTVDSKDALGAAMRRFGETVDRHSATCMSRMKVNGVNASCDCLVSLETGERK